MRDDTKTIEYYEKMYNQDTSLLQAAEDRLKKVIEKKGPDFRTIPNCYGGIADNYFLRFYVSYTMGKSYEELLPDVKKYMDNGIKSCNGEPYGDLERIIYLAIIFNLYEYRQGIKDCLLMYEDYQDKYMEEIYQFLEPEFEITSEKMYWEKDCKLLDEVIQLAKTDKETATHKLKEFVDKHWFKTLKEGVISNTSTAYHGFWCLEAAALVKALKLDDTELKDSKYYPYDMVHFCD